MIHHIYDPSYSDDPYFPTLIRVEFNGQQVKVETINSSNTLSLHTVMETQDMHMDELPLWMQKHLAVLSTFSTIPPMPDIAGVGRRISEDVYWVYYPLNDNTQQTT
jgi:hypothetical protein